MSQDQDYTILSVQKRNEWTGGFGTFQDYALQLEGVDGWVQLTQKPETAAPEQGQVLHGHTEVQTRGGKSSLKFKKVNPEFAGQNQGHSSTTPTNLAGNEKTLEYIVEMLEELTGRKQKPDHAPEDIDDEPIDLAEIPF